MPAEKVSSPPTRSQILRLRMPPDINDTFEMMRLRVTQEEVFKKHLRFIDDHIGRSCFETGTHVEVFGRTMCDWAWVGTTRGVDEHLHLYRNSLTGDHALLRVEDQMDNGEKVYDFDQFTVAERLVALSNVLITAVFTTTYPEMIDLWASPYRNVDLDRFPEGRPFLRRALAVTAMAVTDEDRAEAMLAQLALTSRP